MNPKEKEMMDRITNKTYSSERLGIKEAEVLPYLDPVKLAKVLCEMEEKIEKPSVAFYQGKAYSSNNPENPIDLRDPYLTALDDAERWLLINGVRFQDWINDLRKKHNE